MPICVKVAIDDIISKIDTLYEYIVPDEYVSKITLGKRVVVPFSKGNVRHKGLILDIANKENVDNLKSIISVVEQAPLLSDMQISLLKLLKNRYFVTYSQAYKTIVPRAVDIKLKEKYAALDGLEQFDKELYGFFKKKKNPVDLQSFPEELLTKLKKSVDRGLVEKVVITTKGIGDLTEKIICLNIERDELDNVISLIESRYQRQIDLLSVFYDYSEITEKDLLYYSGCSLSTVKTLERKGLIRVENRKIQRNPYKEIDRTVNAQTIVLNDEQKSVFDSIINSFGKYSVNLINGITGSGKTSVYMKLIDETVKQGKSVIFMVPEISLTPQTLSKFYSRYGENVYVIHSGLAPGERADEWYNIKNSDCSVTVGTRSAVFAPSNNLGLVIMDEEHEYSYKSETSPKYHARDIAKYLCKTLNIPLVLGSATPSIETNYFALRGFYNNYLITKRYNDNPLPETKIIDMRQSYREGSQSFLSEELKDAITQRLSNKEQIILFLNRRGAHTMVGCRSCGYVAKCPTCGVALTYHTANGRCMCHYCGYNIKMFDVCPECSAKHIKKLGIGTQLVYTDLSDMFPEASILRMDYDTIDSYLTYGSKLNMFKNGEYDIMLGTQMVAKGLDFPNVTLVGVINADHSLYVDDFRANERTFSLLTQVCGRSGRAGKEGIAYIQTYSPEHEAIRFAKEQNYEKYYNYEIEFRKAMNYPPFCDLIKFTVSDKSDNNAFESVSQLYSIINEFSKIKYSDIPIRLLYPVAPKIAFFNNKFKYDLVVKTKLSKKTYDLIDESMSMFRGKFSSLISVNVNPINNI